MKHLDILNSFINLKKKKRPHYSNAALARDLDISGAFLSSILIGKKSIPPSLALKLVEKLNMDDYSKNEFLKGIICAKYSNSIFESILNDINTNEISTYLPIFDDQTSILGKWYYIAILELINCSNFIEDISFLANKLNISNDQTREALLVLENEKAIIRDEKGNLIKSENYLRIPTIKTSELIREFHLQMIDQATQELKSKTSDNDYCRRLISGITFTANPDLFEECKKEIENAIHQVSSKFSRGNCTEVYQLNVQLFPLTK